jgi:hypothetical protein
MLTLFLNELSTANTELDQVEARQRALRLLNVLRSVRKRQSQVGLNSQVPLKNTLVDQRYSLAELLSRNEYLDEWRFFKSFANRSPLAAGLDASFNLQVEEVEYLYQERSSMALGWADQLSSAVVSFSDDEMWCEAWLSVNKRELDNAAEIKESTAEIRNFAQTEHVSAHADWLQAASFEWLSETDAFWQQRETLFPYLRFLKRAESDMDTLRVSGAAYYLVLQRLHELNQDIARWVESGGKRSRPPLGIPAVL